MKQCYTVFEKERNKKTYRKVKVMIKGRSCLSKKEATKLKKRMNKNFGDEFQYKIKKL